MKPVRLDYVSPQPLRRQVPGIAVLSLSLIVAGYYAHDYAGLSDRIAIFQSQLEHANKLRSFNTGPKPAPADTLVLRTEGDEANRVIRQLDLPWDELFSAIESIPHENIAILSIQPDTEAASVTISAEAKEVADIAVYMDVIGESGILQDVHLVTHQIKTQDPQKPVDFSISAGWAGVSKSGRNASSAQQELPLQQ